MSGADGHGNGEWTVLHYGTLAFLTLNLIVNSLLLMTVRHNQTIAVGAETLLKTLIDSSAKADDLERRYKLQDERIRQLQERVEGLSKDGGGT